MRHGMLIATLICGSIPLASAQAAADKDGTYMALGNGVDSCGTWTSHRDNQFLAAADAQWLLGYVTAVNAWGVAGSNISKGVDNIGIIAWVNNYCSANPLASVSVAAEALIRTLYVNAHPAK